MSIQDLQPSSPQLPPTTLPQINPARTQSDLTAMAGGIQAWFDGSTLFSDLREVQPPSSKRKQKASASSKSSKQRK